MENLLKFFICTWVVIVIKTEFMRLVPSSTTMAIDPFDLYCTFHTKTKGEFLVAWIQEDVSYIALAPVLGLSVAITHRGVIIWGRETICSIVVILYSVTYSVCRRYH